MAKIAALVQLHNGDAVSGIVSRRLPWFRYLRIEMPELHDSATQSTTKADGIVWLPKSNVTFIQQLVRLVATEPPAGPAVFSGPTLTSSGPRTQ